MYVCVCVCQAYPNGDGRVRLSARFFEISANYLADLIRRVKPPRRVHANENCGVILKNSRQDKITHDDTRRGKKKRNE